MNLTKEQVLEIVAQAIEKSFEYYRNGNSEQAEALCKQILCVDEDNVIALQMLGIIESRKPGMTEQAIKRLRRAEELDPNNADVHNNLGLIYSWSDQKDSQLAEHHYIKAIEINPKAMHFYSNLGVHLKTQSRSEEAEKVLLAALERDDTSSAVHFNYATLLGEGKRWDEAKHHYKKAIELDPGCAPAHHNLATVHLNLGHLKKGWKEYEWRWDTYPQFKKIYERFPKEKAWDGKLDPKGKKFFVYAEQGMGDTIQFVRFLKLLKDRGPSHITFEEHSDLIKLMTGLEGVDKIQTYGDKIEDFDLHCSVVSLPYLLKVNKLKAIPSKPYLKCNYDLLPDMSCLEEKHWKVYDGLHIGIVWGGNPVHRHDPWRSTELKNFKRLEIPGVKLFSLQKDTRLRHWIGFGDKDLTEGATGMKVVDLKDYMLDYNCSAALLDRMDLVICVDTAVAHLAGAMGKKVWLLVAYQNDWRWLHRGKKTPWYPTMRIFRQQAQGDWESVFTEVKSELVKLLKKKTKQHNLLLQTQQAS